MKYSYVWKVFWVLHEITLSVQVLITLYYWVLIKNEPKNKYRSFAPDYAVHLHPLLSLRLDFSLVLAPYKLRHSVFIFIMCFIYCFTCNMPMALIGKPAYKLITWKSGGSIGLVIGLFLFVIGTHAALVGLSWCCKGRIYKR